MTLLHHIYSWEYEGSVAQESNGNKRNDIWNSWLGYPNYGKENYKIKKSGVTFFVLERIFNKPSDFARHLEQRTCYSDQ